MSGYPRRPGLARLHVAASWLLVALIGVQAFLAGAAMTALGGNGDFSPHVAFGHLIVGLAALAVVVTAVIAGLARRETAITFGLLLLYFVQVTLPAVSSVLPALGALHVVNALLLFAAAAWYARRASRWWQSTEAAT